MIRKPYMCGVALVMAIPFLAKMEPEAIVAVPPRLFPNGLVQCGVIDLNRVIPETGNAYLLTSFAARGDGGGNAAGSEVLLFEDTLPLGPQHSVHNDIRRLGRGRYDHWGNALYFSASDNSDPRLNGRTYSWGVPSGSACPDQVCGEIDVTRAMPDTGFSYILPENFGFPGDDSTRPERSHLLLLEGPLALGAPHSPRNAVRNVGRGRYSHWGNALFFSTSDNSDPRSNGRRYYFGGACRHLAEIRLTKIASNAPFYATFGSYNQRIVDGAYGLFIVHLTTMYPGPNWASGGPLDTQSDWQLLRSTDAGASLQRVYLGSRAGTHVPPSVDSDANGAVYVFDQQFTSLKGSDVRLLKFDPASGFRVTSERVIPGMASDKFSSVYDRANNVFYYTATSYGPGHPARIATIDPAGTIRIGPPLVTQGSRGFLMYPLLRLDEQSRLYLAWTSQALPFIRRYLYWDIHFMMSNDQGRTWANPNGQALPTPVLADGDGPADRVTLNDETGKHPWLSSFLPKDGMIHFAYKVGEQPFRKHARRLDLGAGRFDVDHYPRFKGNSFSVTGQGGIFLSRRDDPGGLIYFVGENPEEQRIIVLASDDAGMTWFDYAVGRKRFTSLFGVSGPREIGPSGNIYAVFTDLHTKDESQNANDVWLMQVKGE